MLFSSFLPPKKSLRSFWILGIRNLSNRVKSAGESLLVQVLETSTGDVGVEVLTVEQRVDLNSGLGGVGEGTLGTLASSSETTKGTGIAANVYVELFVAGVDLVA
ncbi:hypothetical protein HBI24_140720 [Parastagonospora nodorum]|nr:hypothetical protein HBH53_216540 [Parastagonospora nodorum]KAH3957719.1 hypothetical protein HBH51_221340 [Parastagonospora nodorum]KAH5580894.1 hypothetical protein HBI24_140720 [Parastagonospora nodorum]KAH5631272.1 hypothetical protein HBI22_120190 [Parastagonospora nodorum]KAH5727641.1 hypothetical protein HBI20_062980 [Parastagonospora nodorum]